MTDGKQHMLFNLLVPRWSSLRGYSLEHYGLEYSRLVALDLLLNSSSIILDNLRMAL